VDWTLSVAGGEVAAVAAVAAADGVLFFFL
jgi:hypothetical protein